MGEGIGGPSQKGRGGGTFDGDPTPEEECAHKRLLDLRGGVGWVNIFLLRVKGRKSNRAANRVPKEGA